ncbi:peptidylprolyl isomerase [Oscillospiraceae bacterium OttesenSCG-928-F05]|nr:peptidylprolyl isomerase [Oscillospiraceae bacterium OttesenSCG-928-F05]
MSEKRGKEKGKLNDGFYKIITVILIVAIGVSLLLMGYNLVVNQINFPAATVGDEEISVQEMEFHYNVAYNNYVQTYGDYIQYFFDQSQPLRSQEYDDGMSWRDYFADLAAESAQNTAMLAAEAQKAGFTLDADAEEEIAELIADLEAAAAEYGVSTEQYLRAVYTDNRMTMADYEQALRRYILGNKYAQHVYSGLQYTDAEAETHYAENRAEFDLVTYRSFYFDGSVPAGETEATEEQTAAAMAAARSKAEAMLGAIQDEQSFDELAYANTPDPTDGTEKTVDTLSEGTAKSSVPAALTDWLFDTSRKAGNRDMVEASTGYYVVFFKDRYREEYNTVSARHILIEAEISEGAESATDEQKEAARAEAERILAEWKGGTATEETFATLAETYSTDGGSNTNGGLYENIAQGRMVEAFDAWIFDEDRQAGDTDIVETDFGYHIMYFSGEGEPYWKVQAKTAMADSDYETFRTEKLEAYPVGKHSIGMGRVG